MLVAHISVHNKNKLHQQQEKMENPNMLLSAM